jgi:penicillin-binding protein 1A
MPPRPTTLKGYGTAATPVVKPGRGLRPEAPRGGGGGFWRVIRWLFLLGLTAAAMTLAGVAIIFWMYGRDPKLPNIEKLSDYRPKQVTTILDANDRRIGELFDERRTFVPFEKIPPIVIDSFVAAEDQHFWTHGGIDYVGMLRALVTNLRAGHTRQGASTITQQVVKTFLLTPERTFKRKIQEIILARRIEKSLTKQEILTLYVNQIYFGHGRYGVQEAARYYFGKDVGQLNVGEAAMLGGLPQSPENISPRKNPQRAKERQTYVLNQLAGMGKITAAEAQKWIDAPIQVVKEPFPELGSSPEWIDLVRRDLAKRLTKTDAELDTLGTTVRTTVDPGLQLAAQRALQKGLRAVDRRHKVGVPVRRVKEDKLTAEVARLAKRLPKGGPEVKEIYEAVVTSVHDAEQQVEVDLGDWPAVIVLGGREDARFNPPDDAGNVKKPSERFAPGDVLEVQLAPGGHGRPDKDKDKDKDKAEPDDDADKPRDPHDEPAAPGARPHVALAPGPEGAVVIIEVKTRKVRALVGGFASKIAGYDRATMAHRQPGSSFKPFVYATAIEAGKATAARVVNDAPDAFDLWRPKNHESGAFEGPVRLRYALAKSINTVAIRVCYEVGAATVAALAHKMGIVSNLPEEMSLALGSGEVTPLEMTNAYATFAAGGLARPPRFVDAIDGKAVDDAPGEQVLRPEVAYVVVDMMRSVVEEGTATVVKSLGIPVAGKTGTSNDDKHMTRDTWFVGLTPDYAIGVWIGYDDNRGLGHDAGGTNAAPVFVDVVKAMNLPAKAFPRPAGVVEATIDKASGLLAPEGAPKGSTMTEVFVEGTAPTEVAAKPGEVTPSNVVTGEYETNE